MGAGRKEIRAGPERGVNMSETTQTRRKTLNLNRDARQNIIIIAALLFVMLFFGIKSPYFLKPANLAALLVAAVPLALIGLGESLCLLLGTFDMSVGMVASLSGIIWTTFISQLGVPTYLALAIALVFGLLSGLIGGLAVAYLNMPAWMATYALMQIWKGIIYIVTGGDAVRMTKFKAFKYLGQYKLFGSPITWAVIIMVVIYVVMYFILRHTALGRSLFVVGGNVEAAKNVGIRIRGCQIFAFMMSGLLAALGGALFASRSGSGQPVIGELYAMQGIAGAVIGGTAMIGGKTNVLMTFAGVMFVVCMQNGLNMIAVPAFYQHITTGLVLVLAILVQTERPK